MGTLAVLYTNMAICAGFSGVAETFILDVAICHYMFSYKITSIISEKKTCMHQEKRMIKVSMWELTK